MAGKNRNLIQIHLVGWIPAGPPAPIPESNFPYYEPDSTVTLSANLLPTNAEAKNLFALEVKGDGLVGAMISDGEILIMSRTNEASEGELAAIWISDRDESTLAYYANEGDRICLKWADPNTPPVYINDPKVVVITGKIVSMIKRMG
jgi:repressor LexA